MMKRTFIFSFANALDAKRERISKVKFIGNRCSGIRESCHYRVFFAGARALEKMRPEMRATKAMSALPPLSLGRMASPETQWFRME